MMSHSHEDNINALPFKLRFTSTQKLCKEVQKMIAERYEMLDKLTLEYDTIGQHKHILGSIKSSLEVCNQSLKELRSLCQCQSDDDKSAATKQLSASEEVLTKLATKCDCIQTVKMVDIGVKRLPSNWRAAMLKIARDKAKKSSAVEAIDIDIDGDHKDTENNDNNGDNKQTNNEDMNENMISTEAEEMSHQFEMDLERKIYETQMEELMQLVQTLVMRIKTARARIDISKQLIKVVLKMKREYESANSKLKEGLSTCHCAEAGADDDPEFVKRMHQKKELEETVDRVSNDLKYWEEQYALLKEQKIKADAAALEVKEEFSAVPATATTTIEVATEEEVPHQYATIASTSGQQSCMYATAGQQQPGHPLSQGTANPAVIYLEGLVAHQQPTYIPASNIHQPIGVYPHTYSINPHHPYAHQAPDGSIQVYSTDISSHPGYIAYQ